jgi:Zn-dependent M28 family amino/carboxypeptidase
VGRDRLDAMNRSVLRGSLAVAFVLAACCAAETVSLSLVKREVIEQRLEAGAVTASARQETIRRLFEHVGCATEAQRVSRKSANVICTLPGETASTVVIGGHYDFADRGQGIVDDWSGASLLPSLYQALKARKLRHTYVFVAFTGEERGLVGSSRYVKILTGEQKSAMHAFVNLECLGLSPTKVWVSRSTPALVGRLFEMARALGLPIQGVNVDRIGDDDTHPFFSAKIPVISIHSVSQETLGVLHSTRDQVSAIRPDDYYDSYRLVALFLAYLDTKLE